MMTISETADKSEFVNVTEKGQELIGACKTNDYGKQISALKVLEAGIFDRKVDPFEFLRPELFTELVNVLPHGIQNPLLKVASVFMLFVQQLIGLVIFNASAAQLLSFASSILPALFGWLPFKRDARVARLAAKVLAVFYVNAAASIEHLPEAERSARLQVMNVILADISEKGLQSSDQMARDTALDFYTTVTMNVPQFDVLPFVQYLFKFMEDETSGESLKRQTAATFAVVYNARPAHRDLLAARLWKLPLAVQTRVLQALKEEGHVIERPDMQALAQDGESVTSREHVTVEDAHRQARRQSRSGDSVKRETQGVVAAGVSNGHHGPVEPVKVDTQAPAGVPRTASGAADILKPAVVETFVAAFEGPETEENWQAREAALKLLREQLNGKKDLPATLLKPLVEPITRTMHSLRTALSLAAFTTANSVINASGPRMEPFVEAMASNSFKQTSCTKKLISAAAETTLMTLITEGPASLRFLNLSVTGISDKNATSRAVAANVLKMMVTCDHQKTVVAGNLAPFMDALKKALQDANASVRETSRGTFTIFRELYPDQANSLYALLDAATKRAIDRTKASAPATSKTTRPSLKAVMAAKKAAAAQKVEPTGSRSITFPVAVEFSAPRTLTAPSSPDAKAAFSNDEPRVHVDDDKESMDVDEHRTSTSDLTASPVATAGNSPIEVSAAPSAAPALEPTQPCTPRSGSVSSSRNRRASRTFTTESDSCPPSPVVRSRNGKMENSSDALGPSVTASYSSTPVARSHDMTKNTFAPTPSTSPFSSHMGSDVMDRLTPSAMDTRGTTPRTADRSAQNMSMDVDESRDDYGGSIMNETLPYGFADTSVVRSVTEYSPPRSPAEVAKSAEPDSINTCTIGPTTPLPSRGRRTYNFGFDTPLKTPINPMAGVERAMRGGTPGTLTKPVEDVINNMEELAQTIERKSARRFNAWRQLWRVWGPKGQTALTSVQKNKLLNHWFDRTLRMAIDFLQDEDPPEGDLVFELVVYLLAELVKLNPKAAEKEARDVIITALVITSWEKRTTSTAAREILRVVKDHFDVSQTMAAIPDIIELQMDDEDTHSQRVVMRAYQFLVELLHHENSMFITSRDIPRMAKPIMMGLRSENSTIRAGTILTIERFYERFADIVLQTWLGDATSIIKYTTLKYLREKGHTLTDDQFWELCR